MGLSREGDIIDLGVESGLIRKSGAFFSYGDVRLGQGRENAKEFLRGNADLTLDLENEIRASVDKVRPTKAKMAVLEEDDDTPE